MKTEHKRERVREMTKWTIEHTKPVTLTNMKKDVKKRKKEQKKLSGL